MGQQSMNTGLFLRRLKNKLRLATFLRNRVVGLHGDSSVGIPVRGHANPKRQEISAVNRSRQPRQRQQSNPKKSLKFAQLHLSVIDALVIAVESTS